MASPVRVEHINPFVSATIETFKSMMHTTITPGKIVLVTKDRKLFDISGIIGLSGGAKGTVSLSFPKLTALKAVSQFIGEKIVTVDDTVKDAIGELANIVAGAAKRELAQYKINISLPTVIIGDGHEVQGGKEVIPLAVPFDSPLGMFSLVVSFKSES
ncbi:MAG: chemotaxis protein CheX [Fibrobacterota bacterium]|nr:chemotaxis protein CheX [Fibrobacterota bacterium]